MILKNRYGKSIEHLPYDAAKRTVKFALGENVKRQGWASAVSPAVQQLLGREGERFDSFLSRNSARCWAKRIPRLPSG